MKVTDLVKDLVDEINSMKTDLSLAKYREADLKKSLEEKTIENEVLQSKNADLLDEIEALQKKIDELEF